MFSQASHTHKPGGQSEHLNPLCSGLANRDLAPHHWRVQVFTVLYEHGITGLFHGCVGDDETVLVAVCHDGHVDTHAQPDIFEVAILGGIYGDGDRESGSTTSVVILNGQLTDGADVTTELPPRKAIAGYSYVLVQDKFVHVRLRHLGNNLETFQVAQLDELLACSQKNAPVQPPRFARCRLRRPKGQHNTRKRSMERLVFQ